MHPNRTAVLRSFLLPLIVLTSAASPSAAEPETPPAIGEREFLDRVERSDPRLEILAARIDASRAEVTDAGRRPNPSVSLDREALVDDAGSASEHFLRLEWPIDLSGRRGRSLDAARKGVDATRAESERDRFLLLLDALDTYHDAAYARLRVATLREGRETLGSLIDVVRSRKTAGDVSGYDLQRLELELAAYDDQLAETEAELAGWRRRLAALVGEPDGLLDAADPLELPALPETAAGSLQRGDHRAAMLRAEQAERERAAAGRSWVPLLVLNGGLKTADLGDRTALGYVAGLSIDVPLFDRGQGTHARSAARRREHLAMARTIEREATAAVKEATAELALRVEQGRRHDASQVSRLADLLRRAQTVYREGDRPIVELLDAHRTAREVRLRSLQIRRGAIRARTALWRARGYR